MQNFLLKHGVLEVFDPSEVNSVVLAILEPFHHDADALAAHLQFLDVKFDDAALPSNLFRVPILCLNYSTVNHLVHSDLAPIVTLYDSAGSLRFGPHHITRAQAHLLTVATLKA